MMPINVCLAGAAGRMGRLIAQEVEAATDLTLTGLLVAPGEPESGERLPWLSAAAPVATSDPQQVLESGTVLIDFTAPPATATLVEAAARHGCPFVSGSTALDAAALAILEQAAALIPVLHAPNMSRGIELLTQLVHQAAGTLAAYDLEIVERHHRRKADAPSGTALRLAEEAARGRGLAEAELEHGRVGHGPERAAQRIGMHALRGGDWVGEHTVILAGPGETLELHHRAESRAVFVAGTLACVRFVAGAVPGRYSMADVLAG